jgi:hypothetical protein
VQIYVISSLHRGGVRAETLRPDKKTILSVRVLLDRKGSGGRTINPQEQSTSFLGSWAVAAARLLSIREGSSKDKVTRMKITNHFPDGTTRSTTAGVRVPYTVNTAPAYQTLAAVSEKPRTRETPEKR